MKKVGIIGLVLGIVTIIIGIILKFREQTNISIIGGADGPTSVFIVGKINDNIAYGGILIGVIVVLMAILIIKKKGK